MEVLDLMKRLLEGIEGRTAQVAVVGLGFVGTTQARLLQAAGYEVLAYDSSPMAIERCELRGVTGVSFSESPSILSAADVIFVCVRVMVDASGQPDVSALAVAAQAISDCVRRPSLVVLVTTVPLGTSRWMYEQLNGQNDHHYFVFAPERIAANQTLQEVIDTPRLIAGFDPDSRELGRLLFEQLCNCVIEASVPEICEASKLLENAFRTQSIALVAEITRLAHAWGIDATEVCEMAATKPFGYFPFYPGPGVGGHCLPNDLTLLESSFTSKRINSPLLANIRGVVHRMPEDTIQRLEQIRSVSLDGASVLLVGVGFKPGLGDTSESPARGLVQVLRRRGAVTAYLDHQVSEFVVDGQPVTVVHTDRLSQFRFDAVLIVSGESLISVKELQKVSDLVLDVGGARLMRGGARPCHRL